jgi:hypothetical protein
MIMSNARFTVRTTRTHCSGSSVSQREIPTLHAEPGPLFNKPRVCRIDRRLFAIDSELSEIKYRLAVIDSRLSSFSAG